MKRNSTPILKLYMKEDPLFVKWLKTGRKKPLSSNSIKSHTNKFWKYVESTGKLPSELYKEADQEQEQNLKMSFRKIDTYLSILSQKLIEEDKSGNYIKSIFTSIKSFYNYYEILTPRMEYETNDNDDTDESLPTKEEIRKALSLANPQYQAIIYLMSSSGISGVDIRNITIRDYLESLEIKINDSFDVDEILDKLKEKEISNAIPVWRIQRKKNNNKQFTFSTPESVKAINIHFDRKLKIMIFPV